MDEARKTGKTTGPESDRFQFSIRQLLVLTTVSALAAALASSMSAPKIFQGVVATYLIFMAAYIVLRLPYIVRMCFRAAAELRQCRSELEMAARNMKQKVEQPKPCAGDSLAQADADKRDGEADARGLLP